MTLSAAFPAAKTLSLRISTILSDLEKNPRDKNLQMNVKEGLDDLSREVQLLDGLADKENGTRKDMWKKKVRGLSDDCDSFRLSFSKHMKKYGNMDEQEVRASLFAGVDQRRSLNRMETLDHERNAIRQSTLLIDNYTEMSRQSMKSLKEQKQTLKASHQKALDVLHQLGLSRTLMKLIDRTDFRNSCLVFFCMLVTVFIFGVTWYYIRYVPRQTQLVSISSSSSSVPSSPAITSTSPSLSAAPGSGVVFTDSLPSVPIQHQRLDPDVLRQSMTVQG